MNKKILIISLFICILLICPIVIAVDGISGIDKNKSPKIVNNSLPDLIVDIKIHPFGDNWVWLCGLEMKNIGDTSLCEKPEINFTIIGLFGMFIPGVKFKVKLVDVWMGDGCLEPGESEVAELYSIQDILSPLPGIYMFIANINNNKSIEEKNYNNNLQIECHYKLFLNWFPIID